jgi:hypothetical protein
MHHNRFVGISRKFSTLSIAVLLLVSSVAGSTLPVLLHRSAVAESHPGPSLMVTTPSGDTTINGTKNYTASGFASSPVGIIGIELHIIDLDNRTVTRLHHSIDSTSEVSWKMNIPANTLPNGQYRFVFTAYDKHKNTSTPQSFTIWVGEAAPIINPVPVVDPEPLVIETNLDDEFRVVEGALEIKAATLEPSLFSLEISNENDNIVEATETDEFSTRFSHVFDTTKQANGAYVATITATNDFSSTTIERSFAVYNETPDAVDGGGNTGGSTPPKPDTTTITPNDRSTNEFNSTSPRFNNPDYVDGEETPSNGQVKSDAVDTDKPKQQKQIIVNNTEDRVWYWAAFVIVVSIAACYGYRNWRTYN